MRLILNKALDNINDNVNLKIIEITSTDFLNNNLDYFVYKYQIPLIKFTDTEEIFNIKNFKNELNTSLSEMELILTESDLELLSGGSGGGTQDLQSVLDNEKTATFENSTIEILSGTPNDRFFDIIIKNFDETVSSRFTVSNYGIAIGSRDSNVNAHTTIENGKLSFVQNDIINSGAISVIFPEQINESCVLTFPAKPTETYTLATLDDIKKIDLTGRVYENNAAAILGGLTTNDVYRTSTGELRIVV